MAHQANLHLPPVAAGTGNRFASRNSEHVLKGVSGGSGQTLHSLVGTTSAISPQICSARSSRLVHSDPCVETHLLSYSAKLLHALGLHHKSSRYILSAISIYRVCKTTTNIDHESKEQK